MIIIVIIAANKVEVVFTLFFVRCGSIRIWNWFINIICNNLQLVLFVFSSNCVWSHLIFHLFADLTCLLIGFVTESFFACTTTALKMRSMCYVLFARISCQHSSSRWCTTTRLTSHHKTCSLIFTTTITSLIICQPILWSDNFFSFFQKLTSCTKMDAGLLANS